MKPEKQPLHLKYPHLFDGQADARLENVLKDLDKLYSAPQPPEALRNSSRSWSQLLAEAEGNQPMPPPKKRGTKVIKRIIIPVIVVLLLLTLLGVAAIVPWLNSFFLGCFVFGLVFTVASFLIGGLSHFAADLGAHIGHVELGHGADTGHGAHIGHHLDVSHSVHTGQHVTIHNGHIVHGAHTGHDVGHNNGQHNAHAGGFSWLNFNALILFVTWFGAVGFIVLTLGFPQIAAVGLAVVGGAIGYVLIMLFLTKVLFNSETPVMLSEDYDLMGTVARVSSTIVEGGMGEVIHTRFGTTRSEAARSLSGERLSKDTQVVILRFENGVAIVEDFNKLLSESVSEKNER